jgi:hypothetical protein
MSDQNTERLGAIRAALLPVPNAPVLRQINGFGSALYGHLEEPGLQSAYFTRRYLTALWLPVVPMGIYLVSHPRENPSVYRFHGRMPSAEFHRYFGRRVLGFYLSGILQSIAMLVGAFFALWLVYLVFTYLWPSRHRH